MRLLSLRTIIAATDLTPTSEVALEMALRLAAAAGAALHVVHVAPSRELAADTAQRARYTHDIGAAIRRMGIATVKHSIEVLSGSAPSAISALADRIGAVGRHRGAALARHGALGSTAYELITVAAVPCLVITHSRPLAMQRVLVATDFSESARGALLVALSWASALRSRTPNGRAPEVLALHVDTSSADSSAAHDALNRELDVLRHSAGDWAGVRVSGTTQSGTDAAAGIVEYAARHEVDLIVLGTRGLTIADNSGMGSVSAAATQRLDVPVLLVPPAVWHNVARDLEAPWATSVE